MAGGDQPISLQPSLLDRLIDPDAGGTAWRRGYGLEQMADAVQRDLEDLLNTRQTHTELAGDYSEVQRSIIGYGLPDLASFDAVSPQQREEIGRLLEAVISRFEPRLKDVRAVLLDQPDSRQTRVRFRIEARLCVEPAPEVAFDTILELTTGQHTVQRSDT
jgi:type VI secretion system protein ImpF